MSRPEFKPGVPIALSFESEILTLRVERGGAPAATLDSQADREALLAEVRAGTFAGKLLLDAVTYIQIEGKQNRNFIRFKAARLAKIAKSGRGSVFLVDHAQRNVAARGGTIVASEAVEYKGGIAFRQTIELVKLWAIEGVLDGTIDRFSIGWHPIGPILCTGCNDDWMNCSHWPGDEIEVDGSTIVVEFEFTDAELVETSGVNVPAVIGTRIEGIRAALTAALNEGAARPGERNRMFSAKIAAVLGLAAAASEGEVLSVVERNAAAGTLLAAEREAHEQTRKALTDATAEVGRLRKEALDAQVNRAIDAGIAAGRIPVRHETRDGKVVRVEGDIERGIRTMAATLGIGAAEEFISRLAVVGPPATAQKDNPDPTPRGSDALGLGEDGRKQLALLGTTEEDVRKYGRLNDEEARALRG